MAKRSTPPLFELLGQTDPRQDRPEPPPPRPAPRRAEPQRPARPEPARAEPEGDEREPWLLDSSKRVTIPLNLVLIGTAAIILVGVVGFSIAWRLGNENRDAERAAILDKLAPSNAVVDPLVEDLPVNNGLVGPGAEPAPPTRQRPQATGSGAFIVSSGRVAEDPRRPGHNYLWIASTPAQIDAPEAARLIGFLHDNGVEALALPVDPGAGGTNNGRYYDVFVLQGVPGAQFQASESLRLELERRIAELGRTWQREHRGTTDLRSGYWKKFEP